MSVEHRPLAWNIGEEILGLDLSKPLDAATVAELRDLLNNRCILLFRDQFISPEEHIAFTRQFGETMHTPALERMLHPDYPQIWQVTNVRQKDGTESFSRNTGRLWHSDQTYMPEPAKGSLLHCKEIPSVGGDTMFANAYLGYEALSDVMKEMIAGLWAVHDLNEVEERRSRVPPLTPEEIAKTPPVTHPLVITHPETGRKILYVSQQVTCQIVGMSKEESKPLLDFLHSRIVLAEHTYRHQWRPGDLVFWDNWCAQHFAPMDYNQADRNERRVMWRTTLAGGPVDGDKTAPAAA